MRIHRLFLLLLCFALPAFAEGKRPITFEDMMALKRVGEPIPSPDGKWVLFTAMDVDLTANTRIQHLWVVPIAGGESRKLTSGAGEEHPRFSPDGKHICYTSQEGGGQIWIVDFKSEDGTLGKSRKLTSLSGGGDGAIWSPDGANILFTSRVYPDCPDDACNAARDAELAKSKVQAKVFTRLLYRHWNAYTDFKRSHLFVVPAAGGTPRDLTPGDYETPPFSLGGQDDYDFSPDGREVAYSSNHDSVEAISTNNDIFIVPVTGGPAKKISTSPGSDETPRYSPDGKYIAWRMQKRAGYESDRFRLVLYDRESGEIRNLTEDFDRWVGAFAWGSSYDIVFSAEDEGESPIYYVSPSMCPAGCHPIKMIEGHTDDVAVVHLITLTEQSRGDEARVLFTRMSAQGPNEIYIDETPPGGCVTGLEKTARRLRGESKEPLPKCAFLGAKQLTHLNDAVFQQVQTSPAEPFWFTGAEGVKVEGFIVKPPDFDAAKKYPVKFLVHGGPQGAWGDSWTYRWNAQLFAASGYVVIMVNPRGSTGYGQKFIDDINGDWGGRAYTDLMLGLDYAERKFPYIDKSRECVLGASFGGYMVNWIIGHTNRFQCAVSHDGVFNTDSAYGTTEELWFNEWEFKGKPWTNRPIYRKWSPHLFATNFKTPTLVVHGQRDYRLDVSEGFQLFTTLQRLGVHSEMLYFPDEGHWVLKPQNSRLWYRTVNGWVDEHVKK